MVIKQMDRKITRAIQIVTRTSWAKADRIRGWLGPVLLVVCVLVLGVLIR